MPKPDSLQGSLDLLVLKILSRRPGLHGYAIMSAIKEWSGDVLRAEEPMTPRGSDRSDEPLPLEKAQAGVRDVGICLLQFRDCLPDRYQFG